MHICLIARELEWLCEFPNLFFFVTWHTLNLRANICCKRIGWVAASCGCSQKGGLTQQQTHSRADALFYCSVYSWMVNCNAKRKPNKHGIFYMVNIWARVNVCVCVCVCVRKKRQRMWVLNQRRCRSLSVGSGTFKVAGKQLQTPTLDGRCVISVIRCSVVYSNFGLRFSIRDTRIRYVLASRHCFRTTTYTHMSVYMRAWGICSHIFPPAKMENSCWFEKEE